MNRTPAKKNATRMIVICGVALAILHQDIWWWADKTLVFGFLPIGLAYHALYSILASLLWAAAVVWAWPAHIEQWADSGADSGGCDEGGPG